MASQLSTLNSQPYNEAPPPPSHPQYEFGFTPDTFRLFSESTLDGERIARERAAAEEARRLADSAQSPLFPSTLNQLQNHE